MAVEAEGPTAAQRVPEAEGPKAAWEVVVAECLVPAAAYAPDAHVRGTRRRAIERPCATIDSPYCQAGFARES